MSPSMPQHYDVVIFDRDGTLLEINAARSALLSQRIQSVSPTLTDAVMMDAWAAHNTSWPASDAEELAFWATFWADLAPAHGLGEQQRQRLIEVVLDYPSMFVVYPDTLPTVETLAARGVRMVLFTNFDLPSVDRTLAQAGISPTRFDLRISPLHMGGLKKPSVAAYHTVAQRLGVAPERCLMVDDTAENCFGALEAGMGALYIDRAGAGEVAGLTRITTLEAVIAYTEG
ncbi:HAD family hydrolase [Chloroflexia bacterium SDU3-3]|nr:HAD family hydrolase [Chloroflexia bacterium SDU3-3]